MEEDYFLEDELDDVPSIVEESVDTTMRYRPVADIKDSPHMNENFDNPLIELYQKAKVNRPVNLAERKLPEDVAMKLCQRCRDFLSDMDEPEDNYQAELDTIKAGDIHGAYQIANKFLYYECGYEGYKIGEYLIEAGDTLNGLCLYAKCDMDGLGPLEELRCALSILQGEPGTIGTLGNLLCEMGLAHEGLELIHFAQKENGARANEALLEALDTLYENTESEDDKIAYANEALYVLGQEIAVGNDTAKSLYERWKNRAIGL